MNDLRSLLKRLFAVRRKPLVIGGTGGSGTTLVARLSRELGYDLGSPVNASEDALAFIPFYDRWNRHAWTSSRESMTMKRDFRRCSARHEVSGARWGWKNPRSMFVLPFLHRQFPDMQFIHVVRDGRDMAFSGNQGQLRKDGGFVLSDQERTLDIPEQSILLWSRINTVVADYGETRMLGQYLQVRFETLCESPEATLVRLSMFLHNPDIGVSALADIIEAPASLGRWRTRSRDQIRRLEHLAGPALIRFGYSLQEEF